MSDVLVSTPAPEFAGTNSVFEFWPGWVFYTPVVLHWMYLGLKYRGLTLATAANPTIASGGLCGESKSAILDQVGPDQRTWIADYVGVTTGSDDLRCALTRLEQRNISFPVVAKPDIGCHGNGVRLVSDAATLEAVMTDYPAGVRLLLQEFISDEGEAGVFYVRMPGCPARITSLTLKHAPIVEGDGRSTLRDLIRNDPRTKSITHLFFPRLRKQLDDVVPVGCQIRLVFTGNHCKGSFFRDGRAEITAGLTRRIDAICRSIPDFHFGRIDVRFSDIAALRRGEAFRVIEVNGVGSEATHIWDPRTTLLDAYRAQFEHYGMAFLIGDQMRRAGHRPTAPWKLFALWRHQTRLMKSYPPND